jgi:hypothetical protein
MASCRIVMVVIAALAMSAAVLVAQAGTGNVVWKTLAEAPLSEDAEPFININGLSVSTEAVAEHSHAGPVFAYIVEGEIENHVEPDPPARHTAGGFFHEAPRQVHKMLRGLNPALPATLIIMGAGRSGVPAALIKRLDDEPVQLLQYRFADPSVTVRYQFQEPLPSTRNQELRVLRLTLPAGAAADARAHSGPGLAVVLDGRIEMSGTSSRSRIYDTGDLFRDPGNRVGTRFRNVSKTEPAMLLLYQVSEQERAR